MNTYRVVHRHEAHECPTSYAAWKGHDSPLRGLRVVSSCPAGGHQIWFDLDADSETTALSLLPRFVAERSEAVRTGEVAIP